MAYIVMAYRVMAYMVMAYIVMAYMVMAYIDALVIPASICTRASSSSEGALLPAQPYIFVSYARPATRTAGAQHQWS